MTSEDIRGEPERQPFAPLRLHFVSGKTIDVKHANEAWMMKNSMLLLQQDKERSSYNIVSLRDVERLERLSGTD